MIHPTFDRNGYPTEETLEAIRAWPGRKGWTTLFAFIREAWRYPDYWQQDGDTHTVATGGWSGNEDLIAALKDNQIAWLKCWRSSERGGRYVFMVPERKAGT